MSMLSHQLATPLGTIRWNAELLRMGKMTTPLDPGQDEIVGEIITGAVRMDELVTDIHDCSRLAQDKFTDKQTPVALADVIAAIQKQNQKDIDAKKLACTVTVNQPLPEMVSTPSILTVIVQNLLSNAIKYTAEGGAITVTVRQASGEEVARSVAKQPESLFLSIADTGYGIPAEQQDQVFSKFFRADNISSLPVNGTGLGSYIVATAVAKLGGGVWFESEVGRGTIFSVVLPAKTL